MSAWASTTIAPTLSAVEARELTDQIVDRLAQLVPLVKRAYEGRADKALGYASWHAYCSAELGGIRVPLTDRPTVVTELRREGMSTRAIGSAIGVDAKTVRNDLASTGEQSPVETVKSLDGRERPATQPKPQPEPESNDWRCFGCDHQWSSLAGDGNTCPKCGGWGMLRALAPEMPKGQEAADRIVDSIEQTVKATREQRETVFAAQRMAKCLPASLLEEVGVIVAGSRAGADVITPELVAALRSAVDVLEAEMLGRAALGVTR